MITIAVRTPNYTREFSLLRAAVQCYISAYNVSELLVLICFLSGGVVSNIIAYLNNNEF
jgi:hypothetical protein